MSPESATGKVRGRPPKYSTADMENIIERYENALRGQRADIATELGIDLRSLRVYIYTWRKLLRELETEDEAGQAIAGTDLHEASVSSIASGATGDDVPF